MSNHTISGGQKQVTLFEIHGVHYMKSRCIGNKVSGGRHINISILSIVCKNITSPAETSKYLRLTDVFRCKAYTAGSYWNHYKGFEYIEIYTKPLPKTYCSIVMFLWGTRMYFPLL